MHFVILPHSDPIAVCFANSNEHVLVNDQIQLIAFTSAFPSLTRSEISWTRDDGSALVTDKIAVLTNNNRDLLLKSARLQDGGRYHINIMRGLFRASTNVTLTVSGK